MKKVRLMLVASGSGTDADSIMQAWKKGCIPDVEDIILVSTKNGAGCIEKASALGIESVVIDRKECGSDDAFNEELVHLIENRDIDLVFLVGCIVHIHTDKVVDVLFFNMHPADIDKYGGNKMYGLEPHERVVWDATDEIIRGKKALGNDRFYTYPTVHEVVMEYDSGAAILTQAVEIPQDLLRDVIEGRVEIEDAADKLQKIVLPFEWLMLPAAVNMAARKILLEDY